MEPLYTVEGRVIRGKGLGRTMGVPTANLPRPSEGPAARNGVYVAQVRFRDQPGRAEPAVLSQGLHPTLPEGEPTVEVYLLRCDENLYGRPIIVEYLHYLRPERRFDSKEALRAQMEQDIKDAESWFAAQATSGGR